MSVLWKSCLIGFAFSLGAEAQWNPEALRYSDEHLSKRRVATELSSEQASYLATLWGGGLRTFEHRHPIESFRRKIFVPRLFDRPISVVFRPFRIRTTQVYKVKAPLIVFVPGVFSDSGNITGQMTLKWFSEMGYHVLVVPNPLAADYVSAGPRNPYPFPQNEVEFVIEATQRAIFEWIDFEWVTDVHIVGESLGAMVAAATLAQDAQSPRPLFKAGGTFLWPPLSLSHSVNQIDQLINRTQAMYSETCRPMIDNLIFQWRVLQGFVLSNPTELETRCAPSLVGHYAFKQNLINVTQVLRKTRGQVPLSADEQMNLRFADFVRDYSFSEPMIEQSPLVSLVHWLKKSETAPWRILSSFDDFINSGLSWDAVGDLDPDGSRLVLLPWGGHIGVSALNEFPRFLRQHFKAPAN